MPKRVEGVCNFCGNPKEKVGPLVEGNPPGQGKVYICSNCVGQAETALAQAVETNRPIMARMRSVPSPRELYDHLEGYVIGQESPKRKIAVQVCNHYRRLLDNESGGSASDVPLIKQHHLEGVEIEKSNILMIGPTGSGKTLLARSLADKLSVPFAIGDATTLTEAGYVGEDVENLLLKLLVAADYDLEAAQRGIIYVDEIDKIGKTGGNVSITRDVSGEGVQQSLLKMIEGTVSNIPPQGGRKHPETNYIQMDTTNILFICGGAFNRLDEIIGRRLNCKTMGFMSAAQAMSNQDTADERNELLKQVTPEDLVEYGLIPELVGRLPILSSLNELSLEDLIRVLQEPKNALLKQEQKKMAYQGVDLTFTNEAIREIATQARKKGTGARGLRAVVEEFMTHIHFDLPPSVKSVVVDEEVVKGTRKLFVPRSEAA